jgi:hypothetical protein
MSKKFDAKDLYRCLAADPALITKSFGQIAMPRSFNGTSLEGGTLHISVRRYAYVGQWLMIQLLCTGAEGYCEPFDSMTKVVHQHTIDPNAGEFLFPAYDVRLMYRTEMLATGYFEDTARRFSQGYGTFEVWRITDKFLTEFAAANQAAIEKACAVA